MTQADASGRPEARDEAQSHPTYGTGVRQRALGTWLVEQIKQPLPSCSPGQPVRLWVADGHLRLDGFNGEAIASFDAGEVAVERDGGWFWLRNTGGRIVALRPGEDAAPDLDSLPVGAGVATSAFIPGHQPRYPWGSGPAPVSFTRTYAGRQADASEAMRIEAAAFARLGYVPISQSYAPGQWSAGAWVLAFLLLIVLIGIIVLFYMLASPPAGTLTVVYERRTPAPDSAPGAATLAAVPNVAPTTAAATAEERLRQLDSLRRAGLITEEEYLDRRRAIVESL